MAASTSHTNPHKVIAQTLRSIRRHFSCVPTVFKSFSIREELLTRVWQLYRLVMHSGGLPFYIKELIGYMTSEAMACRSGMDRHLVNMESIRLKERQSHETMMGKQRSEQDERHLYHFIHKVIRGFHTPDTVDLAHFTELFRKSKEQSEALVTIAVVLFINMYSNAMGLPSDYPSLTNPGRENTIKRHARRTIKKRMRRYTTNPPALQRLIPAIENFYRQQLNITPLPPPYIWLKQTPELFAGCWQVEMLLYDSPPLQANINNRVVSMIYHTSTPESIYAQALSKAYVEKDLKKFILTLLREPEHLTLTMREALFAFLPEDTLSDLALYIAATSFRVFLDINTSAILSKKRNT